MNFSIKATKTTVTPAMRSVITEKLQGLERFLKPEHKVHVEFEVERTKSKGLRYRCEVDIQPNGYYAESFGTDFYEAVDLVIPKIKEQLLKAKDRELTKRKRGPTSKKPLI